jgi:hypothetical protein
LGFHNHGSTFEAVVTGGPKHFSLLPPIAAEMIAAAGTICLLLCAATVAFVFLLTNLLSGWLHCPPR